MEGYVGKMALIGVKLRVPVYHTIHSDHRAVQNSEFLVTAHFTVASSAKPSVPDAHGTMKNAGVHEKQAVWEAATICPRTL